MAQTMNFDEKPNVLVNLSEIADIKVIDKNGLSGIFATQAGWGDFDKDSEIDFYLSLKSERACSKNAKLWIESFSEAVSKSKLTKNEKINISNDFEVPFEICK